MRKKGGIVARTAYYSGWRPTIRKSLRAACPEMAALIKEMWLADFRARPAMKDVVVRIEACVSVGDAVSYVEVGSSLSSTEDKDENVEMQDGEDEVGDGEQRRRTVGLHALRVYAYPSIVITR